MSNDCEGTVLVQGEVQVGAGTRCGLCDQVGVCQGDEIGRLLCHECEFANSEYIMRDEWGEMSGLQWDSCIQDGITSGRGELDQEGILDAAGTGQDEFLVGTGSGGTVLGDGEAQEMTENYHLSKSKQVKRKRPGPSNFESQFFIPRSKKVKLEWTCTDTGPMDCQDLSRQINTYQGSRRMTAVGVRQGGVHDEVPDGEVVEAPEAVELVHHGTSWDSQQSTKYDTESQNTVEELVTRTQFLSLDEDPNFQLFFLDTCSPKHVNTKKQNQGMDLMQNTGKHDKFLARSTNDLEGRGCEGK